MAAAATPLPIDAKRALRPIRSPSPAWPARPRLMAAIAGPSTQLAAACSARAPITIRNTGHSAVTNALMQIAATARPATQRAERTASTSAPPGIWPTSATRPPAVSTRPISTWVQEFAVR